MMTTPLATAAATATPFPTPFDAAVAKTLAASRYAERIATADTSLIDDLRQGGGVKTDAALVRSLAAPVETTGDAVSLHHALRKLRQRVMLRLIHRDINGLADLDEVVTTISALADITLEKALEYHQRLAADAYGISLETPVDPRACMVIVGMGKLGARELNVSSDIDLIFIHAVDGQAAPGRSWHEFHSQVGKGVIRALDEVTADGFVFRVDMRLRPYGASGALVTSLAGLDEYFRTQARPWERYAWLKARAVTGSPATIDALMLQVTAFVYRRYHDYAAIDEMRDLHAQIRAEATKRNRLNDIKVGPGGIREVEFIVQMQQLIRGGRETRLQISSTREALMQIGALGLLDAARVARLTDAYTFLRNLEHRLQYVDDAQTQALPTSTDEQARIAVAMNFADWGTLETALDTHRQLVTAEFDAVFAKAATPANPATSAETSLSASIHGVFAEFVIDTEAQHAIAARIEAWVNSSRTATLSTNIRARLEALIPMALSAALTEDQSAKTFFRVFDLLDAVDKRVTYLALLAEFPDVLERVARIAAKSAWAAELLRRHPVLLDELVAQSRGANGVIDWRIERHRLATACESHAGDTERLYEILRHTKQVITLRLNIADIEGRLGVMALSDELTLLAEMLLAAALDLAWQAVGGAGSPDGFAIIAYGKFGSKELGYASDLDLVYIYDDTSAIAADRYGKLAQRLASWLTTMTPGGVLYDTDIRLRPDGDSGLLVTSLTAFRNYQLHRAWTWEHQALTRARWCAGDHALAAPFEAIRDEVLSRPRDREKLRLEIVAMRDKMRAEKKDRAGALDLKHTRGGIVDVEFIVQYLILAYAHQHPEFLKNLGNFALLARAGELGIIERDMAAEVGKAYLAFRERQHIARNNNEEKTWITPNELADERRAVSAAWRSLFG